MARKEVVRKFELFAIHGTIGSKAAPYAAVFEYISRLNPTDRVQDFGGRIIVLSEFKQISRSLYQVIAFEGDRDTNPTILDLATARTRQARLRGKEIVAERTHALIDLNKRRAAVEYVRTGAKSQDIANSIEGLAARNGLFSGLQIGFTPVPSKGFLAELKSFKRIREVSIAVVRPNASWGDHYTGLSTLIEESNGGAAEITVRASRGGSLDKNDGIVQVVKDVVEDSQPYLRNATVRGTRAEDETERVLSLKKHAKYRKDKLSLDQNGTVPTVQAMQKLDILLDSVAVQHEEE